MPGHPSTTLPPEEASAAERLVCWGLVTAAVVAGCPVPRTIHLHDNGAAITLTFVTRADLDAWAAHVGADPAEVQDFPHSREQGVWLRGAGSTVRTPAGIRIFLDHVTRIPAPTTDADAGPALDGVSGGAR